MTEKIYQILVKTALESVPRALGLCNRNPQSRTFGCCDRVFWHYQTTDVINGRLQEAGLLFALAATTKSDINVYYANQQMLDWSQQVWRSWLDQRHHDGSVAEIYPQERSFCATAFSAAAFVDTVRLTSDKLDWSAEIQEARSTFEWLAKYKNDEVANQMAASFLALSGYAALTNEFVFETFARNRLDELVRLALPGGSHTEYGGVDYGYESISMSCLVRAIKFAPWESEIEALIEKGAYILDAELNDVGKITTSRNRRGTQFVYPSVFSYTLNSGLQKLYKGLNADVILKPQWMDDRYFIPLAVDFLQAAYFLPPSSSTSSFNTVQN